MTQSTKEILKNSTNMYYKINQMLRTHYNNHLEKWSIKYKENKYNTTKASLSRKTTQSTNEVIKILYNFCPF